MEQAAIIPANTDLSEINDPVKIYKRIHRLYPPLPDCPVLMLSESEKKERIQSIKNYLRFRLTNFSSAPLYPYPDDLQLMIDDYFDTLEPMVININKGGKEFTIKPYTITGLCIYCGLPSRSDFYELEKEDTFKYVIKIARGRIEQHYENLLQSGAPVGAIFALKNMNWTDKTEQTINQTVREIKVNVPDPEAASQINSL